MYRFSRIQPYFTSQLRYLSDRSASRRVGYAVHMVVAVGGGDGGGGGVATDLPEDALWHTGLIDKIAISG